MAIAVSKAPGFKVQQPQQQFDINAPFTQEQMQVVNPNLVSPSPRASLEEQMMKDVAASTQAVKKQQQALGISSAPAVEKFQATGIKLGQKNIGQAELAQSQRIFDNIAKRYVKTAGFANQAQASLAENEVKKHFNSVQMELLKKGLEYQSKLAQYGISQAEQAAAAKQWGQLAGVIGGGIIGGYVGGPAGVMGGAQMGGSLMGGGQTYNPASEIQYQQTY